MKAGAWPPPAQLCGRHPGPLIPSLPSSPGPVVCHCDLICGVAPPCHLRARFPCGDTAWSSLLHSSLWGPAPALAAPGLTLCSSFQWTFKAAQHNHNRIDSNKSNNSLIEIIKMRAKRRSWFSRKRILKTARGNEAWQEASGGSCSAPLA